VRGLPGGRDEHFAIECFVPKGEPILHDKGGSECAMLLPTGRYASEKGGHFSSRLVATYLPITGSTQPLSCVEMKAVDWRTSWHVLRIDGGALERLKSLNDRNDQLIH
jgi:hypothetical protein